MDTSDFSYEEIKENFKDIDTQGIIKENMRKIDNTISLMQSTKFYLAGPINHPELEDSYDNLDKTLGELQARCNTIKKCIKEIDSEIAKQIYLKTLPNLKLNDKKEEQ